MPFILRTVEPKFLSRTSLHDTDGKPKVKDEELLAVTNCTLSNALRQLASLLLLAEDIFEELGKELNVLGDRSKELKIRLEKIDVKVEQYDPKRIAVPESDLSTCAHFQNHFTCKTLLTSELFTESTRPNCLKELYFKAGRSSPSCGDRARSPPLLCTPVLGARRQRLRNKVDVEIETRLPAAIEDLRKWTSSEALGDLTVPPAVLAKITANISLDDIDATNEFSSEDDEPIDHKLPSPEEQFDAIINKFHPEVIPIDTSGKGFDRMCISRRSLLHGDISCDRVRSGDSQTTKRRTRPRKPRGKRRNTITGTDQKEIRDAIAGDTSSLVDEPESPDSGAVVRSHSSDLLKKSPYDLQNKKSHFNSLKEWGRSRLRLISRSPSDSGRDTSKSEKSKLSTSKSSTVQDIDDINLYETVTMRRRKSNGKLPDRKISHERNNSYSSSEKSLPITVPASGPLSIAVKLREANINSRRRRPYTSGNVIRDEPHSSSGNWSASSESGRTSIGSEITTTTAAPKSSTSAATSSNSINLLHGPPSSVVSRRRFLNTSGSSSVTSEGTLTPDIHDLHDDMETSSEYSCDTEGYYTSFHMDSGLKTLKEEDINLPATPLHSSNTLTNSSGNQTILTAENEYELFGRGSTSTTTSSAGTVCTTLLAAGSDRSLVRPAVPERKSSLTKLNKSRSSSTSSNINLERSSSNNTLNSEKSNTIRRNTVLRNKPIAMHETIDNNLNSSIDNQECVKVIIHQSKTGEVGNSGADSPDSGNNTCSSPVDDSISSAPGGKLSCSELDYSESSDLEGFDRIERIRVKTTINSSRIPSMCVITPNNSDDESVKSNTQKLDSEDTNTSPESDPEKNRISSRPKLDLPPQETDLDTIVFNDEALNEQKSEVPKIEEIAKCVLEKQSAPENKTHAGKSKIPKPSESTKTNSKLLKANLTPLNNLMSKLKEVFPQKLSLKKSSPKEELDAAVYNDNGEYVTIADVRNNNQKMNINSSGGVYYSNDVVKRNLQKVLSGKPLETEYVSLNELPSNISAESVNLSSNTPEKAQDVIKRQGARVTLDAEGKVIYSSDSLKRRKGAHTTFEPGPYVKEQFTVSAEIKETTPTENHNISNSPRVESMLNVSRPLSPQFGKVVIRAPNMHSKTSTNMSEVIRMPPTNIVTPTNIVRPMSPKHIPKGAYVNIQDAEGINLSPIKDNMPDYQVSPRDTVTQVKSSSLKPNMSEYNYPPAMPLEDRSRIFTNKQQEFGYWTLQPKPRVSRETITTTPSYYYDGEITTLPNRRYNYGYNNNNPSYSTNTPIYSNINQQSSFQKVSDQIHNRGNSSFCSSNNSKDSNEFIKISPIDPRNHVRFQASTPTHGDNKDKQLNLGITTPKSTMSNEDLYAIIHKSKKKMNIKDTVIDRSGSPALSISSLSPCNSEQSISGRNTPVKMPETGYLTDARTRHSWSPANKNTLGNTDFSSQPRPPYSRQCADRLGPVPQTSRLDFKKLLLQHGVRLNIPNSQQPPSRVSAVERLKLSKANTATDNRSVNILDLSSSPKIYTHRRIMKPNMNTISSSPSRTNNLIKEHKMSPKILLSPKTQWRFSSPRSDVLSSPIPEVCNEDESPNGNTEKDQDQLIKEFTERNYSDQKSSIVKPTACRNILSVERVAQTFVPPVASISNTIGQENKPLTPPTGDCKKMTRAEYIQAQKAQFLMQDNRQSINAPKIVSEHYKVPKISQNECANAITEVNPTTLETAL